MTNMPIKRFADFLSRRGELGDYLELFVTARKSIVAARQCRLRVRRCRGTPVNASTSSPRSGTPELLRRRRHTTSRRIIVHSTHCLICAQVGKELQCGHGAGAHVPDHSKR
jgi:hypothetical protein